MGLKSYCWFGLGLYALLSAGDWLLTFALLEANPLAVEANPFAAACLEQHGWNGLALFKVGGVIVFSAAIILLIRRRPPVAAGVVTLGCAVLLAVTTYSHGLLSEAPHEDGEQGQIVWLESEEAPPAVRVEAALPRHSDDAHIPLRMVSVEVNPPTSVTHDNPGSPVGSVE